MKKILCLILAFCLIIPAPSFALMITALTPSGSGAETVGWLEDWEKRVEITLSNTNVDSELTNFPVLVYLSASSGTGTDDVSFVFDELTSDDNRKRIALTSSDGTTQLYGEIERWDDANEKAWIWVKVPTVSDSEDTTIFLYFDDNQPENTTYIGDSTDDVAHNVWDSNYVAVMHMAQDPDGDATDAMKDSTSNENDGTPTGTMTSADLVDGKIGKAIEFDGSDDGIELKNESQFDFATESFTLEAFFYTETVASGNYEIAGKHHDADPSGYFMREDGTNGDFNAWIYDSGGYESAGSSGGVMSVQTWYYGSMMYDATGNNLYANFNGTDYGPTGSVLSPVGNNNPFTIGKENDGTDFPWEGQIDEVRVSNIKRTDDWLKASRISGTDGLASYGSEEEYANVWLGSWENRIPLTISNTNVDSDLTDFPVLVYLSTSSGTGTTDVSAVFDELKFDGNRKKIAITSADKLTQLYVEIERWDDANEKAWLWVKVPTVSSSASTLLYLYYDINQPDNAVYVGDTTETAAQNVWDANFLNVYHMAQDPNGDVADSVKDSTSNATHADPEGTMTTDDLVDGKIGKAIEFDGSDDALGGIGNFAVATGTTEAYINMTTDISGNYMWVGNGNGSSDTVWFSGFVSSIDDVRTSVYNSGWTDLDTTTGDWETNTYYSMATLWGTGGMSIWVGGAESINNATTTLPASPTTGWIADSSPNGNQHFKGIIDEVRISDIQRSDEWLKATYYSNEDGLIAYGSASTSAPGWLSGEWDSRILITLDDTNVDGSLANIPVLLYISAASGPGSADLSPVFDELASDANRKKIAVTKADGVTELYVEIERWDDANEKAWLWVKVPKLYMKGSNSLFFYFDADHADNDSYVGDTTDAVVHNVWDSNYALVYHMAQDPNGDVADSIKDSTSNENDGTPVGSMTTADLVDAYIGKGLEFDGSNDYISVGDHTSIRVTTGLTIEIAANLTATTDEGIIQKGTDFNNEYGVYAISNAGGAWKLRLNASDTEGNGKESGGSASTGTWYSVFGSYGDQTMSLSVDTASIGSSSFTGPLNTDTNAIRVGDYWSSLFTINGLLDEVRLSNIARSADYEKATYYSNTDDLAYYSSVENDPDFLSGWDQRLRIDLDNSFFTSAETDFPVLVYLSASSGKGARDVSYVFDELASDANRKKIAVTSSDGETELYAEIERWDDANEKAWLWVKIPTFKTEGNAMSLFFYFDADHADNTTYIGDTTDAVTHNVWNSDFSVVYHMAQDPNGDVAGSIKDSTSNGDDADPNGSMVTADLVDGQIGKGIEFDGSSQYLDGITEVFFADATGTIEVWGKWTAIAANRTLVGVQNGSSDGVGAIQYQNAQDALRLAIHDGGWDTIDCVGCISAGTFYGGAGTWDGSGKILYLNGTAVGTNSDTGGSVGAASSSVGRHSGNGPEYMYGIIDEVRYSTISRDAEYLKATYNSNIDNIGYFSAEETP